MFINSGQVKLHSGFERTNKTLVVPAYPVPVSEKNIWIYAIEFMEKLFMASVTFLPDILMVHLDPIYMCSLYVNNFDTNWSVLSGFYSMCLDVE